jgi:hypothetical protein
LMNEEKNYTKLKLSEILGVSTSFKWLPWLEYRTPSA